jgi:hypothetical protein
MQREQGSYYTNGQELGRPSFFYKYRSLDAKIIKPGTLLSTRELTRRIITERQIWFAKPTSFNDPFDCSPVIHVESTFQEAKEATRKAFKARASSVRRSAAHKLWTVYNHVMRDDRLYSALIRELKKNTIDIFDDIGVLSVSETGEDVLMWSHYADNHAGICLRFRSDVFPFMYADRVRYSPKRPAINPLLSSTGQLEPAIFTKADFWQYEKEWRIVAHQGSTVGDGPGLISYHPAALDAVILGIRTSEEDRKAVERWIKNSQASTRVIEARADPDNFRVLVDARNDPSRKDDHILQVSGSNSDQSDLVNGSGR